MPSKRTMREMEARGKRRAAKEAAMKADHPQSREPSRYQQRLRRRRNGAAIVGRGHESLPWFVRQGFTRCLEAK